MLGGVQARPSVTPSDGNASVLLGSGGVGARVRSACGSSAFLCDPLGTAVPVDGGCTLLMIHRSPRCCARACRPTRVRAIGRHPWLQCLWHFVLLSSCPFLSLVAGRMHISCGALAALVLPASERGEHRMRSHAAFHVRCMLVAVIRQSYPRGWGRAGIWATRIPVFVRSKIGALVATCGAGLQRPRSQRYGRDALPRVLPRPSWTYARMQARPVLVGGKDLGRGLAGAV